MLDLTVPRLSKLARVSITELFLYEPGIGDFFIELLTLKLVEGLVFLLCLDLGDLSV